MTDGNTIVSWWCTVKGNIFPSISAVSFTRSSFIWAFFIAAVLDSNKGMSEETTSVFILTFSPTRVTGSSYWPSERSRVPPPNRNTLSLSKLLICSNWLSLRVSKYPSSQRRPHTVEEQALSNTAQFIASVDNTQRSRGLWPVYKHKSSVVSGIGECSSLNPSVMYATFFQLSG